MKYLIIVVVLCLSGLSYAFENSYKTGYQVGNSYYETTTTFTPKGIENSYKTGYRVGDQYYENTTTFKPIVPDRKKDRKHWRWNDKKGRP